MLNFVLVEQHVGYSVTDGELSASFGTHQVTVDHLDLEKKLIT